MLVRTLLVPASWRAYTLYTDVKLRAYEAGILPPLIQLLTTRERMVLQNSIATIRNLSFHPEVKAALMEAGAMCVSCSTFSLSLSYGSL
jgi:hypothetical protein